MVRRVDRKGLPSTPDFVRHRSLVSGLGSSCRMRPPRKGGALDHPGDVALMRLQALVARQRGELDGLRSLDAERSEFDLARGIIMGKLGCSPSEARRQLERMAGRGGINAAELAARICPSGPPT